MSKHNFDLSAPDLRRRRLLQMATSLPMLGLGRVALAQSGSNANMPRFLLVFLRGGYDAANVVIPYSSKFYYDSRPTIAIAKPDSKNPQSAFALNSDWALHPALRTSLEPMYARKEALFIPFAGTADTSRSHFETQDSIEAGYSQDGNRNFNSGFMSRLAQTLSGSQPIAFTDALPTIFKGPNNVANISLKGVGKAQFDQRQGALLAEMYAGHRLEASVREGLDLRSEVARDYEQEMQAANRGAVSPKGFEVEARRIARLMRDRYQLGFVDVGGWDTHVNQGGATGALANNLDNLGQGLAAFAQEIGPAWKQTVVVVVSEFGRTFRENGTRGTDHGHGTAFWVLGGGIHGGRVLGEQVKVDSSTLFQNRDFPVLNDYRSVLGGLFQRMYGLDSEQIDTVFPGVNTVDVGVV